MDWKWYKKTTERMMREQRVVSTREISNGYATAPKGTKFTITDKFSGLSVESDGCDHCGLKMRIRKCNPNDFEMLADG